ncbi:stage III sporulation protein AF [Paenibacillus phoenicis]|uniref:Stage III sporulation protein AF n=1 Tax=Paenibacillus phoenicis TaxID=554117 RepID=A0ABU5PJD3_9BACL|nr:MULTISPECIES: stage III sporulation protein AF [Paenibacillus]EES72220.1 stage III sporulation protein AF [Paenibacillus sp. oral taxon 786 str. D14]MCT2195170.1 stage III sporulation protein AF [Paenibacillus sp. p3-SID1389]MEA3570001.1 stage III sporulation protein AF [Paenibacillus phoenicis]
MDWLAEWLREIIFIVLIAVFIDLLLPNRAMERYVRFVVSLLILLTLISPVMRFFSADAKDQLEAAFSTSWDGLESHSQVQSTEAILQQGEKLREKQESEALAWAGEEAARQMKQQIERSTGRQVERVTVKLKTKPAEKSEAGGIRPLAAEPVISSVEVVMAQVKSEEQTAKADAAGRGPEVSIAPVEKIKISVNTSNSGKTGDAEEESEAQSQAAMASSPEESLDGNPSGEDGKIGGTSAGDAEPAADRLVSQIEELLQENWGVDREAITVLRAEHLND